MSAHFLSRFNAACAILVVSGALVGLGSFLTRAATPGIINYQGRIQVGGSDFTGTGKFRFALVSGTTTLWTNDGSQLGVGGGTPTNAVAITVTKGLYSVILGNVDGSLGYTMTPIPASAFGNSDVRLRIWFDDGTANGVQQLTPDQRIAASGYAMVAATVDTGAVTTAMIAAGAVTNANIASVDYSKVTNAPVLKAPTVQKFTGGTGTYATPAGVLYLRVRMVGGGGGGGGSGGTPTSGTGGNVSYIANIVAGGGAAGAGATSGVGGAAVNGNVANITGGYGAGGVVTISGVNQLGGSGGSTPYFGGGAASNPDLPGRAGIANTGGGGSGGSTNSASNVCGAGGGSGAYAESLIYPSAGQTLSYSVGTGGPGGAPGTGGAANAGGKGADGIIIVEEYYQ